MTAKRKRAVSAARPPAMVPGEKPGPAPSSLLSETAAVSSRAPSGRGWFEFIVLISVYITASLAAQLLLAAWYRLVDEADE